MHTAAVQQSWTSFCQFSLQDPLVLIDLNHPGMEGIGLRVPRKGEDEFGMKIKFLQPFKFNCISWYFGDQNQSHQTRERHAELVWCIALAELSQHACSCTALCSDRPPRGYKSCFGFSQGNKPLLEWRLLQVNCSNRQQAQTLLTRSSRCWKDL